MLFGNIGHFRNFLTQVSSLSVGEQMSFVETANASALGAVSGNQVISDINAAARSLIAAKDAGNGAEERRIQWLRWTGDTSSGVGLALSAASASYLLLPAKSDPPYLHVEGSLPYGRYNLFANTETLVRADGAPLAYIHQDLLRTNLRPEGDAKRFARLLRMVEKGSIPPFPTFRQDPQVPIYWIDERYGGVHWSVLGLQKGMEFVLGEVRAGSASAGTLALTCAAETYPAYDVVLSEGPDLKDALPDETCFGAGDPVYKPLVAKVNDRIVLRGPGGEEVGWARLVAGGAEGRHADAASGLSGGTSSGGRTNQEDGFYIARFRTHDGRDGRVFVVADGLGGNEMGEMASSAGLQGVHAGIVRALREKRIPLAGDLFQNAREALDAQILFEEMESSIGFPTYTAPDTVISIAVVIDGEATIAAAGDALTLLATRDTDGRVHALGYADVEAKTSNVVTNTLRGGRPRLSRASIPKGAWLASLTDGTAGGLSPSYKHHTATAYREDTLGSFPEQSLFYNILHVLEHAPSAYAGPALHDAGGGIKTIPGGGDDPDAPPAAYPGLRGVIPEEDNWTAAGLFFDDEPKAPDFEIPPAYGPLESVFPIYQYVFAEGPYSLHLPRAFQTLSVGSALHPQKQPMVVLSGDEKLAPLHARVERVMDGEDERFFLEKRIGRGRIVILNKNDIRVASLIKKGSRHEIQRGQLIRLTPRTFFRFL